MQVLWGILIVVAGLLLLVCGSLKSEFIVYRLLVARSRILWGGARTSFPPDCRSDCYRFRGAGSAGAHLTACNTHDLTVTLAEM